jgi:hypothetical protein
LKIFLDYIIGRNIFIIKRCLDLEVNIHLTPDQFWAFMGEERQALPTEVQCMLAGDPAIPFLAVRPILLAMQLALQQWNQAIE